MLQDHSSSPCEIPTSPDLSEYQGNQTSPATSQYKSPGTGQYNVPVFPAPCPGCGRCPTCGHTPSWPRYYSPVYVPYSVPTYPGGFYSF